MTAYVIRRILLMVPTLLGMTLVVFFIMAAAPGDVADMLISRDGQMKPGDRQARIEYIKKRYGLDDPLPVQYLRWLHGVSPIGVYDAEGPDEGSGIGFAVGSDEDGNARQFGLKLPDFGHSFIHHRPVTALIGEHLPITLLLNILALPTIYFLAIVTGVYAAYKRSGTFDVVSGVVMIALWSIPTIWAGVMLQGFLANQHFLQWFPRGGIHGIDSSSMTYLPTSGGFWQTVGFALHVMLWAVAVCAAMVVVFAVFQLLIRMMRNASFAGTVRVIVWSMAVGTAWCTHCRRATGQDGRQRTRLAD